MYFIDFKIFNVSMFCDLDSTLEINSDLFTADASLEDQIDVYVRQKNLRNVPKPD